MQPRHVLGSLLALVLAPAFASAGAVNLGWRDCGSEAVRSRSFACDTNIGGATLVGSFVTDPGFSSFVGVEAVLRLGFDNSAEIPDWWQVHNPGSCRQDALRLSLDYTGDACLDPWHGTASGGIVSYSDYARGAVAALLRLSVSRPTPVRLEPWSEYFAFRLDLSYEKTVGDGACDGCQVPVCIELLGLGVRMEGGEVFWLCQPAMAGFATWQRPFVCPPFDTRPGCDPVPVINRTWGAMKSLYR